MFNSKLSRKPGAPDGLPARALNASTAAAQNAQSVAQSVAQSAAQSAAENAQSAAQAAQAAAQIAAARVAPAAQTAAHEVGKQMREGITSARGWAAPQLEHAADYTTATVAPRIADALRSTAHQVSPRHTKWGLRKPSLRSAVSVSVLAIGALAAAGAVAVVVRRQYKAAMEADTESDVMDIEDRDESGTAKTGKPSAPAQAGSRDGSSTAADTGTGAGASGRTSASGW